jgi:hypothetical protein
MSKSIHTIFVTIFAAALLCADAEVAAAPQANSPTPPDDITLSPDPVPERPGSSGPGQGGEKNGEMQMEKELSIAGVVIPWGEARDIPSDRALRKQAGQCVFRYRYVSRRLEFKAVAPAIVAFDPGNTVGKASRVVHLSRKTPSGPIALNSEIALEPGRTVIEVDENSLAHVAGRGNKNGRRHVIVNIQGNCGLHLNDANR